MGKTIPVILCGGSGTRLWPLSRAELPKQFLNLVDPDKSLLQKTFDRALSLTSSDPSSLIIVTHHTHEDMVRQQLAPHCPNILTETLSRNTGPAVALAADFAARHFSEGDTLFVMPCDAHIEDISALHTALNIAVAEAEKNKIAVFGIKPRRPETGYGYIKTGISNENGSHNVTSFVEKPDQETAWAYLNSGEYLWNSGMSVFKAKTVLDEFKIHAPALLDNIGCYENISPVSFDVAILEKTKALSVIPCHMQWSDIGTWTGLLDILKLHHSQDLEADNAERLIPQRN